MLSTIRIAVISAVLSATFVSTIWTTEPTTLVPASSKPFTERVTEPLMAQAGQALSVVRSVGQKGDRLEPGSNDCRDAAWPYVPDECISKHRAEMPRTVRTVTIEMRNRQSASALVRIPQTVVAAR
jgi:hypothetical protein